MSCLIEARQAVVKSLPTILPGAFGNGSSVA
jgi:hypothetical protein